MLPHLIGRQIGRNQHEYRYGETTYRITLQRKAAGNEEQTEGEKVIPLRDDGQVHVITMVI